ncbi:MAG: leucine-rich repeat protein [Butyrivibrio sp.]|nr:leucine-rich repeat protein [Muribaculum sp.]MCM1551630.1 leucine-rich repeat protein [Butyrivibrio sp.]
MKGKRILALILSVAMVATSGNLTMDVYAMGNPADMYSAAEGDGSDKAWSDSGVEASGTVGVTGGTDATKENVMTGDTDPTNTAGGAGTTNSTAGDEGVQTTAVDYNATEDADDTIIDENDYFVVVGEKNGKLQLKQGISLDSLSGTVKLPSETKWIPVGIFNNNTKITGITIPENNQIERIDAGAFEGSGITSFEMPDGVTQLEKGTFKDSKLTVLIFGKNSKLTVIGEEAFRDCEFMTTVSFPDSVTKIEDHAFDSCGGLRTVQLNVVEVIGDSAFKNCANLQVIGWSKSLKEIRSSAFYRCTSLTKIEANAELGANVTTWGSYVFEGCSALTEVRFHRDAKQIPIGMFKDCTALATVVIPEACGVIKREAFSGCTALKAITVPANVSAIEADAFVDCQNLKTVEIRQKGASGVSDIILSEDAFPWKTSSANVTMCGYDGTVEDYANKKNYKFKTLFESYKVKVSVNNDSYGKAELSKTSARAGDTIEVTVTPAEGYRLKASTFAYNGIKITDLKEEANGTQVFTFEMPDEEVKVIVDFESATLAYGTLSATFDQIDQMTYDWDKKNKILTFDKVGLACQLIIDGASRDPGSWMFNYSSDNPKVAYIDSKGVIYARGMGTATIKATLKDGINNGSDTEKRTVEFKVKVENEANIYTYSLSFSDLGKAKSSKEEIAGETVWVIRYTKDSLLKTARSFKVNLLATEGANTQNIFVKSSWESANTDMVTLENETVENNSNVVKVLADVTGETAVTVTVTNGKTGKDKVTLYEESFIIRVIGATPQLVQYKVSFDLQGHGDAIEDITVVEGEKLTAPAAPTAEGYVFGGWYKDADCTQAWDFAADVVNADTILYAKWTPDTPDTPIPATFTVSYHMQGIGSTPDAVTVEAGAKLTAPAVTDVLGYLFQGWFKEAGCITAWDFANDVVTADTVLYAKWIEDPNTETPEDIDDSIYEASDRKDLKAIGAVIGTIKAKTYDGSAYLPTVKVTVKDGKKTVTLTEGTDYRVLYQNNINAGTGTVIVKGNGTYTGEVAKEFTITKKSVKKLKVVVGGMGLNDKSAPPVYVYDGGKLLGSESYTLSYAEDMTAAKGTKKVTITGADNGNYTGSRTVNVKVYDAEKILNPENVSLEKESFDYTGKALKPAVTVTYGGAAVDKKNYTVKYQNNKEAGIGYVIITGKKEYGGSVVKTFEIKPVQTKFALKKPAASVTYNGKLQKPKVTVVVQDGGKTKTLKAGKDYTITYSNNLHATTEAKQAVITIKGKGNYANTPKETFKFDIKPQKIKKASVKGTQGSLTLTYAKRTLKAGTDYTLSYGTENKGKVEVKIEGKGDFTDSVTKKVKLAAK